MKSQILFSGKNKENISRCHLLKILPRVLSVKYLELFTLLFSIQKKISKTLDLFFFFFFFQSSQLGVPVTLRVDPKGYILYWRDQNKVRELVL